MVVEAIHVDLSSYIKANYAASIETRQMLIRKRETAGRLCDPRYTQLHKLAY
jgi:hypothetical protein